VEHRPSACVRYHIGCLGSHSTSTDVCGIESMGPVLRSGGRYGLFMKSASACGYLEYGLRCLRRWRCTPVSGNKSYEYSIQHRMPHAIMPCEWREAVSGSTARQWQVIRMPVVNAGCWGRAQSGGWAIDQAMARGAHRPRGHPESGPTAPAPAPTLLSSSRKSVTHVGAYKGVECWAPACFIIE
jgi:hypothetical protein